MDLALFYKSIAQLLLFFHVITSPSPSFPASAPHNSSPATTSGAVDGARGAASCDTTTCGAASCDTTTSQGGVSLYPASPAQDEASIKASHEAAIKALISHQPNSKSHLCVSPPCLMSHLHVSSLCLISVSHVSSPCTSHLHVSSPCLMPHLHSHLRVSFPYLIPHEPNSTSHLHVSFPCLMSHLRMSPACLISVSHHPRTHESWG